MNNLREAEVKDKEFVATKQRLRASLYQHLISYKKLVEEVYVLKDDQVETFDVYFEREKKKITLFHPGLDLNHLDVFKVFYDEQLVDDKDNSSQNKPITFPINNAQAETEGDMTKEDNSLEVSHQGDA